MMKKLFLSVFLLITSVHNAQAALELELTQGIEAALPISVSTFAGELAGDSAIGQVVSQDLQMSGRFRQIPSEGADAKTLAEKGIDYLVTGSVSPIDTDHFRVNYQLLQTAGAKNAILNRDFSVSRWQMRHLAHRISDEIYHELTGDRGIFSTRIAYVVVQRPPAKQPAYLLEVADVDGHNQKVLLRSPHPIMSPAWSPDGKSIAYVSFENERAQIFSVVLATGERQLLTRFPGINGAPTWSPDGRNMAVVLSKTGQPKIYLVDLQSRKIQKVTDGQSIDTEPSFSPDGKSLIFTSNRGGSPQIYKLNLANNSVERLTYAGAYNARASYSSDGKFLALIHRTDNKYNIAVQDLTSGAVSELTNSGEDASPSFSPNGKLLLYATRQGEKGVLSVVSVDGKVRMRLPSRDGNVQEPAWSPFIG